MLKRNSFHKSILLVNKLKSDCLKKSKKYSDNDICLETTSKVSKKQFAIFSDDLYINHKLKHISSQ